jgi:D-arabinose 5-phosphate isomerase GutQ
VLAVELLHGCTGRIVVSGIGKSGHIARKICVYRFPCLFCSPR